MGDIVLVVFGLLLSLPLVVWGSGVLAKLMNRFPLIISLGGGVLGFVALELILKDAWVHARLGSHSAAAHHLVPAVFGCTATALGWWCSRKRPAGEKP